ncbi:MAG: hypothetical protein HAW62_01195 [Endozoicomonadaceae bacterium]|nr:hypothetical protein [Endozoicomonadaceae bacterium]
MSSGNWTIRAGMMFMTDPLSSDKKKSDSDNIAFFPSLGEKYNLKKTFTSLVSASFITNSGFGLEVSINYPADISVEHNIVPAGSASTVTNKEMKKIGTLTYLGVSAMLQYHFSMSSDLTPFVGLGLTYNRYKYKAESAYINNYPAAGDVTNPDFGVTKKTKDADATHGFSPTIEAGINFKIDENICLTLAASYSTSLSTQKIKQTTGYDFAPVATAIARDADSNPTDTAIVVRAAATKEIKTEGPINHSPLKLRASVGFSF